MFRSCSPAAQTLAAANVALAYHFARRVHYRAPRVPLDQLNSEALVGLCYAAAHFVPGRSKFSAYASWAILQTLNRFVVVWSRKGKLDLPTFTDLVPGEQSALDLFAGREPDPAALAAQHDLLDRVRRFLPKREWQILDLFYRHGYDLRQIGRRLRISYQRVQQLLRNAKARAKKHLQEEAA